MFYVYLHITKDTNEVFYVGKGKGNRAYKLSGRNKFWHNIVNKHGFKVKIIENNLTEDMAILLERKLITEYGRRDLGEGSLVNLTNGGDGICGKVYSDIEKSNLSKKMKLYYNIDANRQKRKLIAREVNSRPEVKEKLRLHALRTNSCDKFLKMKSENTKNSWNDPEIRKKRTENIKKVRSSEESKTKTVLQLQKTYVGFVSPSGEIYTPVINLTEFCKQHNLTRSGMYDVNSGKLKHHKGWKLYNPENDYRSLS